MRKIALLLIFLFSFVFPIGFSQPFVSGSDFITIYSGENKTIEYVIINRDVRTQTFTIFVSGFFKEGVSIDVYPKLITLAPNEETKIKVYIEAKKFVKEIKPTIFYLNLKYENQTIEKPLIIQVLRRFPVFISSLELSKYSIYPLETISINLNIQNTKEETTPNYKAVFSILYNRKEIYRKEKITEYIPPLESIKIIENFTAGKYQNAGRYDIVVKLYSLKDELIDEISTSFEIKPIEKVPSNYTKKETKYSFLEAYVKIEIKNEGNIPSKPFYLVESLPVLMKDFFYPFVPPDEIETVGNHVNYKWLIQPLQPGESIIIEYKISLWQTWLVMMVIILLILFLFRKTYLPSISKTAKKEGSKIKVIIKVKNNSRNIMKDVSIEDTIPIMFKLISFIGTKGEETENKKTKEKKLVWKINELKPDEEAIFSYYLQPLVELVSITLPAPKLKYIDKRGIKIELKGREISL